MEDANLYISLLHLALRNLRVVSRDFFRELGHMVGSTAQQRPLPNFFHSSGDETGDVADPVIDGLASPALDFFL